MGPKPITRALENDAEALKRNDLAIATQGDGIALTDAGQSFLARRTFAEAAAPSAPLDAFRAQHLSLADAIVNGRATTLDESESPLIWLARRKGSDGRPLIELHQLQAGERLRGEFTLAQLMPRTTANWQSPVAGGRRDGSTQEPMTDKVVAARQRLRHALDATGPEFAGLLLDVCCFLKKLDVVERERRWPARSAKVVLQLALERLARHFGYQSMTAGKASGYVRNWSAGHIGETDDR